ncbi:MAG TPA: xanthine dehydrogenase family protein subunit M [Planktothrix sp.]
MKTFDYVKESDLDAVLRQASNAGENTPAEFRFIAGGTTLVDLMKLNVEAPSRLLDITSLSLDKIETTANGGLKIGALVRNSDLANHPFVQTHYAALSEAILAGASPQLRNRATTGGNLLQRTRCMYFRDEAYACNKRVPGSGCPAIEGHHRNLAILGTSDHCVANNPSDMNVAMMAMDARIEIHSGKGSRMVPITEFYRLPGDMPHLETVIQPGELITHVHLDALPLGASSMYLKLRDRASYEFALASAAVITQMNGERISYLRVAMGGIGAIPWRAGVVEKMLQGERADKGRFEAAADALLKDARPLKENAFKVELAKRCLVHSLIVSTSLS